jgi:hypothetical protein
MSGLLTLAQKIAKAVSKKGSKLNKAELAKIKKLHTSKKTPTSLRMKADYEVDIGTKPTVNVRSAAQRKVRGTSGKAADKGPDPVVVGSRSMPSMADINAASGRARAKLVNRLDRMAKAGNNTAEARLKRLDKKSAAEEAKRIRAASQRTQKKEDISVAGSKKREKVKTSDVIIGDKKNGINYKTGEVYGKPTPNQMDQFARHVRAKMRTVGFGKTSPEFSKIMAALKKLKYPAAKKLVEMLKKTYFTSKTMNKGKK